MPDRVSVTSDGLFGASFALRENANQLVPLGYSESANRKASGDGAACMIAAVNQFIGAYAERLRDRGRLVADAGTAYAEADDNAATTIRDAAM